MAISGTTAVIGAWNDRHNGTITGSAYVFDTAAGQQVLKLTASDAAQRDRFGWAVSVSGTTAIVGACQDDDHFNDAGSAYVFDTTTGQQLFKPTASDAEGGNALGHSVALSGSTAITGAFQDDDAGPESSSAYMFDVTPCPGDIADDFGSLGADSMVSFGDFLALLGLVGPCPGGTLGCADDFGTVGNEDSQVSLGDFLALLGLVGPCP